MKVCIVKSKGKKVFGKIIKYSVFKNSYLVEFRRPARTQWILEDLVLTRISK